MMLKPLRCAFLLALLTAQGFCQTDQETAAVDVYANCNSSSVEVGGEGCVEIDEALTSVASGMTLHLRPGLHTISNSTIVRNLANVSITGATETATERAIITCKESQGLAFFNISRLFLSRVTISNCGLSGEMLAEMGSTLSAYVDLFIRIPSATKVAVFIGLSENVGIFDVAVTNTTGIGLVGVNIHGDSIISNSLFANNRHKSCRVSLFANNLLDNYPNTIGGGAYFFLSDLKVRNGAPFSRNTAELVVANSSFVNNTDCSPLSNVEANYQYIVTAFGELMYPIGGGGGLTILLAQRNLPINVLVTSCTFLNNSAIFGGGVHIGVFTTVNRSRVIIIDSVFYFNEGYSKGDSTRSGGGGLAIFTGIVNPLHSTLTVFDEDVQIFINGSLFYGNRAVKGGGLFTFSSFNGQTSLVDSFRVDTFSVRFILTNCTILRNSALYGSGLSFQQRIDYGYNGKVAVELSNVTVAENFLKGDSELISTFAFTDSSSLHLESVTAIVSESLEIRDNTVSGAHIFSSALVISSEAKVSFVRNSGLSGGGVHLAGVIPVIIIISNASLVFRENSATLQGGAVYVTPSIMSASDILQPLNDECFFLPLPSDRCMGSDCYDLGALNISVSFQDNTSPLGGTIYGSTLESCAWTVRLKDIRDQVSPDIGILQFIANTFPDVLDIDQPLNSPSVASTVPSSILVNASQIELLPGQRTRLTIIVMDDYNNDVPGVVSSLVSYSDNNTTATSTLGESGYWFADKNSYEALFQITGPERCVVNVTFFTTDTVTKTEVSFYLGMCPVGIVYDNATSSCICDYRINTKGVICDDLTFNITIPDNVWVGASTGGGRNTTIFNGDLIIRECGSGCVRGPKPFISEFYDTQCSKQLLRSGVLCGGCVPGASALFGSLACRYCTNYSLLLIPVFGLAGIVLFVSVALLGLSIDKAWVNIVLFYCNILSIFGSEVSNTYGFEGLFVPPSLLSLKIGIGVCFYDGMTALSRTGLQLIFPLYLYILMGVFALLCHKYTWLSKRFSPTNTLVTLTVMCYVSILSTIVDIFGGMPLITTGGRHSTHWQIDPNQLYFRGSHVILILVGIPLVLFYILPFPILMLLPSLLYRFFRRLKPFYDALWAPFKLKYRFWLGIRLIVLVVIFSLPRVVDSQSGSNVVSIVILLVMQYLQLVIKPFASTAVNYVDNFLTGTVTILLIITRYKDSLDAPTVTQSVLGYISLFVLVGAGYATVVGVLYLQLSSKFSLLKSIFDRLCCQWAHPVKEKATTTEVTHTEVVMDEIQSPTVVHLQALEESHPRLRESLLDT